MATITSNQVTVTVTLPHVSNVVLSASPTSISGSGTVTFTATVTGGNNIPEPNVTVTFYDNGTNKGTATTNSSGVATFTYTYSDVSPGTDSWYATAGSVTSNTVSITLASGETYTLTLVFSGENTSTDTLTTTVGTTVTATATLTSSYTGAVSNATITLIDQTTGTSQTAVTNSSGVATFNVKFNSTGTYNFVAQYTTS